MRDYLSIGATPAAESCAQVGSEAYNELSRKECRAYIDQLRREFGPEPVGAELKIKSFPHYLGSYYEVVCYFDDELEDSVTFAYKCEGGATEWDDEARHELGLSEGLPA